MQGTEESERAEKAHRGTRGRVRPLACGSPRSPGERWPWLPVKNPSIFWHVTENGAQPSSTSLRDKVGRRKRRGKRCRSTQRGESRCALPSCASHCLNENNGIRWGGFGPATPALRFFFSGLAATASGVVILCNRGIGDEAWPSGDLTGRLRARMAFHSVPIDNFDLLLPQAGDLIPRRR